MGTVMAKLSGPYDPEYNDLDITVEISKENE